MPCLRYSGLVSNSKEMGLGGRCKTFAHPLRLSVPGPQTPKAASVPADRMGLAIGTLLC